MYAISFKFQSAHQLVALYINFEAATADVTQLGVRLVEGVNDHPVYGQPTGLLLTYFDEQGFFDQEKEFPKEWFVQALKEAQEEATATTPNNEEESEPNSYALRPEIYQ